MQLCSHIDSLSVIMCIFVVHTEALCGVLGYRDFFRQDWLDQILSWQWQPRGCWGEQLPSSTGEINTGKLKTNRRGES